MDLVWRWYHIQHRIVLSLHLWKPYWMIQISVQFANNIRESKIILSSYNHIGPQLLTRRVILIYKICMYAPAHSTSLYGNAELNFVMNSKVDALFSRVLMGWMLVVEITGPGELGCHMPQKGVVGPILRYSARPNRSMLLTDDLGKIIFDWVYWSRHQLEFISNSSSSNKCTSIDTTSNILLT